MKFPTTIICLLLSVCSFGQKIFPPSEIKRSLSAYEIDDQIKLDGILDELFWENREGVKSFVQVEPQQGKEAKFKTIVKIIYNDKKIFIGVQCLDSLGRKGIRVPNLRRDFDSKNQDIFGITFDPFLDQRNSQTFEINPYGAQRDLLVTDGNNENIDWNTIWNLRTKLHNWGWSAEIEIPWSSLRYPNGQKEWGVNFYRLARRTNELSVWSPVPRAFSVTRMDYAGLLKELNPPPPSTNIQTQPYSLITTKNSEENNEKLFDVSKVEFGGELKWAIGPNTVLDFTVNTDFAQAEVDRNVVNTSRFSVFFPERRQFFLENGSLFTVSNQRAIQPFFSRSIGLDASGNPIPINLGLRMTHRDINKSIGGMVIRQSGNLRNPATTFAVARYSSNFGKQNRIGGLLTAALKGGTDSLASAYNYTGSMDGFIRFNDPLSLNFTISKSETEGRGGDGYAAATRLTYNSNDIFSFLIFDYVGRDYNPEVGFLARSNYFNINPGFIYLLRPNWLPQFIRSYEPAVFFTSILSADQGLELERIWSIYPFFITFQDGSSFSFSVRPNFQRLNNNFYPLGVAIEPGEYNFTRNVVEYNSDSSNKISWKTSYSWGGFYDGNLNSFSAGLTLAPISQTFFTLSYELNRVKELGIAKKNLNRSLLTPELRLALNPRVHFQAFSQYQFDRIESESFLNKFRNWNVRFSWEFKPLSFLYLIFNNSKNDFIDPSINRNQIIGKLTYIILPPQARATN